MTDGLTVSELKNAMLAFLEEPRTKGEIIEHMRVVMKADNEIMVNNLMLDLSAHGIIMLAPSTNATRWIARRAVPAEAME